MFHQLLLLSLLFFVVQLLVDPKTFQDECRMGHAWVHLSVRCNLSRKLDCVDTHSLETLAVSEYIKSEISTIYFLLIWRYIVKYLCIYACIFKSMIRTVHNSKYTCYIEIYKVSSLMKALDIWPWKFCSTVSWKCLQVQLAYCDISCQSLGLHRSIRWTRRINPCCCEGH